MKNTCKSEYQITITITCQRIDEPASQYECCYVSSIRGKLLEQGGIKRYVYLKVFQQTFIHIHTTSSNKNNPPQIYSHLPPLGYHKISLVCIF